MKKTYCRDCKNCLMVNPINTKQCFLTPLGMPMCKVNTKTLKRIRPKINKLDLQNHNETLLCFFYHYSLKKKIKSFFVGG